MRIVYFSNITNNTHRFVQKLELTEPAIRIPVSPKEPMTEIDEPYILITPTYGSGVERHLVPKQVVKFLNKNHNNIRGVIASGNMNFGKEYAAAGDIIAKKCNVPLLARFEIFGTPYDVERITQRLEQFCQPHSVT